MVGLLKFLFISFASAKQSYVVLLYSLIVCDIATITLTWLVLKRHRLVRALRGYIMCFQKEHLRVTAVVDDIKT